MLVGPRRRAIRWGRSAACLLGAFLITLGGRAPAGAQDPGPAERALRFVTFNMLHGGATSGWKGDGQNLEARLDLATDALMALAPDVVALQEASSRNWRGTVASRLAGRLGMNHVYHSVTFAFAPFRWLRARIASIMDWEEGPAILSRFPILRTETYLLPTCGRRWGRRGLVFAEVQAPGGRIAVFSTHTDGDPCHTRMVSQLVKQLQVDAPGVLMGDFNAQEGSPAIAALTVEAGFVDAFRAANPDAPGATSHQPVIVPERRARRRIDYVFLAPAPLLPATVVASRVVLDRPGTLPDGRLLWPSDHYGVLAELALFPESARSVAGDQQAAQDHRAGQELPGPERLAE